MPTKTTAKIADGADRGEPVVLRAMMTQFGRTGRPIEVDFLKLAGFRSGTDRATHLLHPYPAKLLLNIPYFFLRCPMVAPKAARLLDPFCGSGTVLLEGRLAGMEVAGADSNPLARLISSAKSTPLNAATVRQQLDEIVRRSASVAADIPDVVNRAYWFSDAVSEQLGKLRAAIGLSVTEDTRDFYLACFSVCVRKASRADPRLSVPVRINPNRAGIYGANGAKVIQKFESLDGLDVVEVFRGIVSQNLKRAELVKWPKGSSTRRPDIYHDARSMPVQDGCFDVVITSPPYVGAQKYIRASSLSLGWLGLTPGAKLRIYDVLSIGREHLMHTESASLSKTMCASADTILASIQTKNPTRARIAHRYIQEMTEAIAETHRVIRAGGYLVLVVGPNSIAGHEFNTPEYLRTVAEQAGFRTRLHLVDHIRSRGLMTKRNKTAGMIAQESVWLFQREE
nr:hypothetical protein [uncultured Rhodopila sp.]